MVSGSGSEGPRRCEEKDGAKGCSCPGGGEWGGGWHEVASGVIYSKFRSEQSFPASQEYFTYYTQMFIKKTYNI